MSKKNKHKKPKRQEAKGSAALIILGFALVLCGLYFDGKKQERDLEKFKIKHNCIKKEI